MDLTLPAPVLAAALLAGMLISLEIGRRVGLKRLKRGEDSSRFGAVEGAVFALFGLLVAFTFSGAATRFDTRRMLIADEANAIGTAYLRVDLLASDDQPGMRQLFRDYVDSRLEIYRLLPDLDAALEALKQSNALQGTIWARAVPASRQPAVHPDAGKLLLPAVNEMFDTATTRTMAARTHPPQIVYVLLFALGFGCALLAGHAMAGSPTWSWLHAVAFAIFVSLATYVILDIEYPRAGFIRLTAFDRVLVDLRESMK